jgi:hypothetical protein
MSADAGAVFKVTVTDSTSSVTTSNANLIVATYSARQEIARPDPANATYHLDAVNGSDTTGNGTAAKPYKTFAKVRPLLHGGEIVSFHDGTYDALTIIYTSGEVSTPYTDWVTLIAAPGATPIIASKVTLSGNWENYRALWNGNFDLRVRLIGLTFADGISISNVNLVRVEKCAAHRIGPWNGTVTDVEKTAVAIRACRGITIEDCDVTETAHGINGRGNDLVYRRNHIHDNAGDGIRLTGCDTVLVEGNHIHNLDDGTSDATLDWDRHCDGLQAFSEGAGTIIDNNYNVTIR